MSSAGAAATSKADYLSKRYGDDRKEKKKKKHKKEEKERKNKSKKKDGGRWRNGDPRYGGDDDSDSFGGGDDAYRKHDEKTYDDGDSEEDRPVIVESGEFDDAPQRDGGDSHNDDDRVLGHHRRRRYDSEDDGGKDDGASKRGESREKRSFKRRYDSDNDDDDRGGADRVRSSTSGSRGPSRRRRYDSDDDDNDDDDRGRRSKEGTKRRYDSDDDSGDDSRDHSDRGGEGRSASGHRSGLQSGRTFGSSERDMARARRDEAQRTVEAHGVGDTVYRDKSSLRRQHTSSAPADATRSANLTPEEQAAILNVGRVQREAMEARQQRMEQLATSSFARHQDDEGLEEMRKNALREGDPMAAYAASKQERTAKASSTSDARTGRPVYKGPPPKPNRYGIRPGFRWDGVDRGNGFEDRLLAKRYSQQHQKELAYRMSSADM